MIYVDQTIELSSTGKSDGREIRFTFGAVTLLFGCHMARLLAAKLLETAEKTEREWSGGSLLVAREFPES